MEEKPKKLGYSLFNNFSKFISLTFFHQRTEVIVLYNKTNFG